MISTALRFGAAEQSLMRKRSKEFTDRCLGDPPSGRRKGLNRFAILNRGKVKKAPILRLDLRLEVNFYCLGNLNEPNV
jgi:hypothetical protein